MSQDQFRQAEDQFFLLRGQLEARRITREQFEAALKELMIQDAQGRYWMIGADSGTWYVHDGRNWVEAQPSVARPEVTPPIAPPPPPPQRGSRLTPLFAIGCIALLCLLGVGGLLYASSQGLVKIGMFGSPIPTLAPTLGVPVAPTAILPATPLPPVTVSTPAPPATLPPTAIVSTPAPPATLPPTAIVSTPAPPATLPPTAIVSTPAPPATLPPTAIVSTPAPPATLPPTAIVSTPAPPATLPPTAIVSTPAPPASPRPPTAAPPTLTPTLSPEKPRYRLDSMSVAGRGDIIGINLFDTSTGGYLQIYGEPGISSAAFSRDGTRIVISSGVGDGRTRVLRTTDILGKNAQDILQIVATQPGVGPGEAIWSPDGTQVAVYFVTAIDFPGLFKMNVSNSVTTALKTDPTVAVANYRPRYWSVDDKWIVAYWLQDGQLYAFPVNGGEPKPISQMGNLEVYDERYWPWKQLIAPAKCKISDYFNCD
jgi:hypothetical protein